MGNFIWPDDLSTMSHEQARQLLIGIRERREKIGDKITRLKKIAGNLSAGQVRDKIDKEFIKYKRLLEKADKILDEAEKRLNNMVGLQLQLDDAGAPPSAEKDA